MTVHRMTDEGYECAICGREIDTYFGYVSLDVMRARNRRAKVRDSGMPADRAAGAGLDTDDTIEVVTPEDAENVCLLCSSDCWEKVRAHLAVLFDHGE